jgi:hypothetical protein
MKKVTVVIPSVDDAGTLGGPAVVTAITDVGLPGPQGVKGDKGDQGPGILSNITRITASIDPPTNPEVNDLWIDLT